MALCLLLGALIAHAEDAQWVTHTLRPGDTVYGLSRTYSIPVSVILEFNRIEDPSRLREGSELVLPGVYEIERGDTLYSLSRAYDVPLSELLDHNGLDEGETLRVGQIISVPGVRDNTDPHNTGDGLEVADSDETDEDDEDESDGSSDDSDSQQLTASREGDDSADESEDSETENDSESDSDGNEQPEWPHDGERTERGGRVPGVSIEAAAGDQVRAVAAGSVTFVGPYAGFGEVVIVESPSGYVYVYGGNSELHVEVGETVERGTVLGNVGTIGSSSRVHFSVWQNDAPVDPENAPRG